MMKIEGSGLRMYKLCVSQRIAIYTHCVPYQKIGKCEPHIFANIVRVNFWFNKNHKTEKGIAYLNISVGRLVEAGELGAEYIDIEIVAYVVGQDELGEADLPGNAGPPHHQVALAPLLHHIRYL